MTHSTGVELTLLFQASLFGVVATAILVVGTRLAPPEWTDGPEAATRWAAELRPVVCEVRRTLAADGAARYDRLQRRLLPLSTRLDRHAATAPPAVDDELVVCVTELGYGCRAVGMELTRAQRVDWEAPDGEVVVVRSVAEEVLTALDEYEIDDGDDTDCGA
ncbi:hypothetical protein SAMN04487948_12815 [Halogranum amylolyticum]|uniref:Uncharacterized protein n=1 Tax=Halogranum amylolyticum TaxID=660520 RepID=A0A1H8WE19_9EURY|nr:hypothetical protein [Halogranum amylolyticum]SEP25912.1 hypothetical protein SAMN04487948_12815 [Halogranum amylolyticum]